MDDDRIIELIVRRYGETIHVREQRAEVLDLVRRFTVLADVPEGGLPPAGAPPACVAEAGVEIVELTADDLMRQLLHLTRAVDEIRDHLRRGDTA